MNESTLLERRRLEIKGIVQGVGFRPFIYRLALNHGLKGYVLNNTKGVIIDLEGESSEIDKFITELKQESPPLAKIKRIDSEKLPLKKYRDFEIKLSRSNDSKITLVSPDIATCKDCRRELLDPDDRRYHYPFINCTNCGPRFTIIKKLPYDRKNTTMSEFSMCMDCMTEYRDPLNRRFHAQPNACNVSGPRVFLLNKKGEEIDGDPIKRAIGLLNKGKIIAIKGLGGFHLACNAKNKDAITELRRRKKRPAKPFALMARDIETINKYTYISDVEKKLLKSPRAPIVLLEKKETEKLPSEIAPDNNYLGFMLPYTPLHILIFEESVNDIDILIMTSGNLKGTPILFNNEETLKKLGYFADYFLMHNRDIHIQADDTVLRTDPYNKKSLMIRRSRGYVPEPIKNIESTVKNILGCGAHLRNTFSLARGDDIIVSHHLGNLELYESIKSYERGVEHFSELFDIKPEVVAVDLHPEYTSTKFGRRYSENNKTKIVEIQHHHAHIASCLVDNSLDKKVIGIAWDGTGYGDDDTIWGGEFLVADLNGYKRKAHLKYVSMPGSGKAIREPWRMAATYLWKIFGDDFLDLDIEFVDRIDKMKWEKIKIMIERNINCPKTSSIGRLFDAVSSLTGIRDEITYLGQAAIELEMISDENDTESYDFEIEKCNNLYIIDVSEVIKSIVNDIMSSVKKPFISTRFHRTLGEIITRVSNLIRKDTGISDVVLTGGVMQNINLRNYATEKLGENGFTVHNHSKIPPNDGGISVGQVAVTAKLIGSH